MQRPLSLLPIIIFIIVYLGSGIYFSLQNIDLAFYQISPAVATVPALVIGVLIGEGSFVDKVASVMKGIGDRHVVTMCMVFILAGAFSKVTHSIGSIDSVVNFCLSYLPSYALLPGLFIISAFISLSIGSSMGVVGVITPIAVSFAKQTNLPMELNVGIVISGAMFGDNLSVVSDTTIAAIQTQGASLKKKFQLNAVLAFVTAFILLFGLFSLNYSAPLYESILARDYSLLKIVPYVLLIFLALIKLDVFTILLVGIVVAGVIGFIDGSYNNIISYSKDIETGFRNMNDIFLISLLIGGMSGFMKDQGGIALIVEKTCKLISKFKNQQKGGELVISFVVSIIDICVANNTIAIILSGSIAKRIAHNTGVLAHRSACFLDIFSCVFQGILPYSAQVLLAGSISGVSLLSIVANVHYCYILGAITLIYILLKRRP